MLQPQGATVLKTEELFGGQNPVVMKTEDLFGAVAPEGGQVLSSKHIVLPDEDEKKFRKWYLEKAGQWGLDPDPDNPLHKYDYRKAFVSGAGPGADGHWPSQYKDDDHPNRFVGGVDTKYDTASPEGAQVLSTEELRKSIPLGMSALGPGDKVIPLSETPMMKRPKEAAGFSRDPKVNYYAELIVPRIPMMLMGPAGYIATPIVYEGLTQIKNLILSIKEKSKYDPLAMRSLTELIPADSPEWLRVLAGTGEMATDMALAMYVGKTTSRAVLDRTINRIYKKGIETGHSPEQMAEIKNLLKTQASPGSVEAEIKRAIAVEKSGVKQAKTPPAIKPAPPASEPVRPAPKPPDVGKTVSTGELFVKPPAVAQQPLPIQAVSPPAQAIPTPPPITLPPPAIKPVQAEIRPTEKPSEPLPVPRPAPAPPPGPKESWQMSPTEYVKGKLEGVAGTPAEKTAYRAAMKKKHAEAVVEALRAGQPVRPAIAGTVPSETLEALEAEGVSIPDDLVERARKNVEKRVAARARLARLGAKTRAERASARNTPFIDFIVEQGGISIDWLKDNGNYGEMGWAKDDPALWRRLMRKGKASKGGQKGISYRGKSPEEIAEAWNERSPNKEGAIEAYDVFNMIDDEISGMAHPPPDRADSWADRKIGKEAEATAENMNEEFLDKYVDETLGSRWRRAKYEGGDTESFLLEPAEDGSAKIGVHLDRKTGAAEVYWANERGEIQRDQFDNIEKARDHAYQIDFLEGEINEPASEAGRLPGDEGRVLAEEGQVAPVGTEAGTADLFGRAEPAPKPKAPEPIQADLGIEPAGGQVDQAVRTAQAKAPKPAGAGKFKTTADLPKPETQLGLDDEASGKLEIPTEEIKVAPPAIRKAPEHLNAEIERIMPELMRRFGKSAAGEDAIQEITRRILQNYDPEEMKSGGLMGYYTHTFELEYKKSPGREQGISRTEFKKDAERYKDEEGREQLRPRRVSGEAGDEAMRTAAGKDDPMRSAYVKEAVKVAQDGIRRLNTGPEAERNIELLERVIIGQEDPHDVADSLEMSVKALYQVVNRFWTKAKAEGVVEGEFLYGGIPVKAAVDWVKKNIDKDKVKRWVKATFRTDYGMKPTISYLNDVRFGEKIAEIFEAIPDLVKMRQFIRDNGDNPDLERAVLELLHQGELFVGFRLPTVSAGGTRYNIPAETWDALTSIRHRVDALSAAIKNEANLTAREAKVFDRRMYEYLITKYKVHHDVSKGDLLGRFKKDYEPAQADIDALVKELRQTDKDKKTWSDDQLENFIRNELETEKRTNQGEVRSRNPDLSPAWARVFGEISDPTYAACATLAKQSMILAQARMMNGIMDNFPEMFSDKQHQGLKYRQLPNSYTWGKARGKFIDGDLYTYLMEEWKPTEKNLVTTISKWFTNPYKMARTILSVPAHIRQALGNTYFDVLGGCSPANPFNIPYFIKALNLIRGSQGKYRKEWAGLIRETITENQFMGAEVETFFGELFKYSYGDWGDMILKYVSRRKWSPARITRFLGWLWNASDQLGRIAAHLKNKDAGVSSAESAFEVNLAFPNYRKLPQGLIRGLRQFPVLGPFVSFQVTVVQKLAQNMFRAEQEIRAGYGYGPPLETPGIKGSRGGDKKHGGHGPDPELRNKGFKRLFRVFLAGWGITEAASFASRKISGVTWEEQQEIEKHRTGWQRFGTPVWFRIGKKGQSGKRPLKSFDLTWISPFTEITKRLPKVIGAAFKNEVEVEDLQRSLSFMEWPLLDAIDTLVHGRQPGARYEIPEEGSVPRDIWKRIETMVRYIFLPASSPIPDLGALLAGVKGPRAGTLTGYQFERIFEYWNNEKNPSLRDAILGFVTGTNIVDADPEKIVREKIRQLENKKRAAKAEKSRMRNKEMKGELKRHHAIGDLETASPDDIINTVWYFLKPSVERYERLEEKYERQLKDAYIFLGKIKTKKYTIGEGKK